MRVRIIITDSLVRHADTPSRDVQRQVLTYTDRRSLTVEEALDAAWRISNAARHKLTESEAALRDVVDARSGGLRLGVGDLVEVDGVVFECLPDGWRRR